MSAVAVDQAVELILDAVVRQPTLRIPLLNSTGHVLAEEIEARWPLPPWTASSMDGFAVRAGDIQGASTDTPKRLRISGGDPAGAAQPSPLEPGTAWRVATGGRVPDGADSVVRQEDTDRGDPVVKVLNDRDAGQNIRPLGGDFAAGDRVLKAGTTIDAGCLAVLAAAGVSNPMVFRRPRVAVITSGDELVALDHLELAADGQRMVDVNQPTLCALVEEFGGVVASSGPLPDGVAALRSAIETHANADLLITAGAVSVGDRDHVPEVMKMIGGRLLFQRVLLRPGGPTTAVQLPDGRIWLGLPGNPVSALVTFHLFARPAIRAMLGDSNPVPRLEAVILETPIERHPRLELSPRVILTGSMPDRAKLTGGQASWLVSSLGRADGLLRIPAGESVIALGSTVDMLRLRNVAGPSGRG
jgi:molybdopterin molybdotransferase